MQQHTSGTWGIHLQHALFSSGIVAELTSWHEDLPWEKQGKRFTEAWELWQQQQDNAEHIQQFVLMQHNHMVDFCKAWLSFDSSSLGAKQLQRFVAAVSRITLRQQMRLVLAGYEKRFARIGVITPGTMRHH